VNTTKIIIPRPIRKVKTYTSVSVLFPFYNENGKYLEKSALRFGWFWLILIWLIDWLVREPNVNKISCIAGIEMGLAIFSAHRRQKENNQTNREELTRDHVVTSWCLPSTEHNTNTEWLGFGCTRGIQRQFNTRFAISVWELLLNMLMVRHSTKCLLLDNCNWCGRMGENMGHRRLKVHTLTLQLAVIHTRQDWDLL
jgi:hypothetical protein